MEITRRNAITTVGVVAGTSAVLAACGPTPVLDIQALEQQLVEIIDKVQKGVKDACTLVPAATSVLAVLKALAGSESDVAKFLAAVQEGITFIAQACPAQGTALRGARTTANIKGKDVPIIFY